MQNIEARFVRRYTDFQPHVGFVLEAIEVFTSPLNRKFGALPDWTQTRLQEANKPTLNR